MSASQDQLVPYIQDQLRKGYTSAQVRTFLVANNYSPEDVDHAMNTALKDRLSSLNSFAKQEAAKGTSPEQLRQQLLSYGYSPGDVDQAISHAIGRKPIGALIAVMLVGVLILGMVWFFALRQAEEPSANVPVTAPIKTSLNASVKIPSAVKTPKIPILNIPIANKSAAEDIPKNDTPTQLDTTAVPEKNVSEIQQPTQEQPASQAGDQQPAAQKVINATAQQENVQRAANICREVENPIYHDACFDQVSKASNDPEYCLNIVSATLKDDCYMRFVLKDNNISLCDRLSDVSGQDACRQSQK
ncbi:MAG TPA: hypothetical protein VJI75_01400 [Candidatus Nanoarchaeia archaeon]|nr:hypothetical protein [Candidatus Nanoarchaeia archaeon]